MKHKGSICDYVEERNRDLLRAFHEVIASGAHPSVPDIYRATANSPASRFWVSEERAAVVLTLMFNKRKLPKMIKSKREMFNEIYRRAVKLKAKNPDMTMLELATNVVHQPAPKFYLTGGSTKVIITYAKKKWYEERRKKLKHLFY